MSTLQTCDFSRASSDNLSPKHQGTALRSRKPLEFELYALQEHRDQILFLPEGEERQFLLHGVDLLIQEIEAVQR